MFVVDSIRSSKPIPLRPQAGFANLHRGVVTSRGALGVATRANVGWQWRRWAV